jgi:hypothetical protein
MDPLAVPSLASSFVDYQLDFRTPGDRGLGRISTEIPRLGAYFRKSMSRLSQPELRDLYGIIQDLMLRGYLTRALLLEAPPKQPVLTNALELYETWLAGFYSSDPSQIQPIDFFGDGPRIPFLVVSKYSQGGKVNHTYADHASVVKFIERNWHLQPLTGRAAAITYRISNRC